MSNDPFENESMLILTVQQMQMYVTEHAIVISLFVPGNRWRCSTALRWTCWLISIWQTDAGITAEPRHHTWCNTMPPSNLPSGFFAELPRRSAQPTCCLIWIWKATASSHCCDWLSADCKNVCHSFALQTLPWLAFNIRIMLLICYLAILSRGVNCPQLLKENAADIDFKLKRFFIAARIRVFGLG